MLAPVKTSGEGERPRAERRAGARQRLTMRVAKLRCLSGEYVCIVHDVSEAGARLRLFHAHPPDSHMFLELANGELYAIERRWLDGDVGGYRFSAAVDLDELLHDHADKPRRPVRLRLEQPVRFVAGGEPGSAHLANLSSHGACLEAGREIPLGALLRLELPEVAPRFAHVCWRREYRHGLAFQQALPLEELARLAFEWQPFDPAPAAISDDWMARAIGG
jgi:hypothetical protein